MPTWNSRKSQDTTNCRSKTKCAQSVQRHHGLAPVDYWNQRGEHDGTANTVIELSQQQKMKWPSVHSLKHSNLLDQGWHRILVIRRLATFVIVRQFPEEIKRLRFNRHNSDTKITCWMRSTSRRIRMSRRWAASVTKSKIGQKNVDTFWNKSFSARSWQQRTYLYRYWRMS